MEGGTEGVGGSFACMLEVEQELVALNFTLLPIGQDPSFSPLCGFLLKLFGSVQIEGDRLQIGMQRLLFVGQTECKWVVFPPPYYLPP